MADVLLPNGKAEATQESDRNIHTRLNGLSDTSNGETEMETVAELEARVIAGDDTVKPTQLTNALAAERLAALQRLSDERKAKEAEDNAHAEAVAQFMADYEKFMTTDVEPLREAYADVVVAIADLYTRLEEHKKEQAEIMGRSNRLGLSRRGAMGADKFHPPVREDRERWMAQCIGGDFIELAVSEGIHGFAQRNSRVIDHVLHTDERREELRTLTLADRKQRGVEMRDRMLNEALAGE